MPQNVGKREHRTENESKKQALMYFNSAPPPPQPKKLSGFEIKYEHVPLFVHLYNFIVIVSRDLRTYKFSGKFRKLDESLDCDTTVIW